MKSAGKIKTCKCLADYEADKERFSRENSAAFEEAKATNKGSKFVNRHRKLTHCRRRILTHPERGYCINLCA